MEKFNLSSTAQRRVRNQELEQERTVPTKAEMADAKRLNLSSSRSFRDIQLKMEPSKRDVPRAAYMQHHTAGEAYMSCMYGE